MKDPRDRVSSKLGRYFVACLVLMIAVVPKTYGGSSLIATNTSLGLLEATTGFMWLDSNGAITNLSCNLLQGYSVSSTAPTTGQVLTYNGSAWAPAAASGGGGGPNAFSFTNQSGVTMNTTITSNTITLSGFTGPLAATCTGCLSIVRNGIPGSSSAAFESGDTIALEVLSSTSPNTLVTATVTIGTTTSGVWDVTTGSSSNNTPNPFSFQNQTNVVPNTTITSNFVQLSYFTGTLTATCNSGCTNISVNGVWANATSVSGVPAGAQIRIQQTSSASTSTTTSASVTVGTTTSSAWSVTTSSTLDPCSGSPSVGTTCADGTLYAGLSDDGNVPMYTTPCDFGQSWNGTNCTGSTTLESWNDGSQIGLLVGAISTSAGQSNTATLVVQGTSPSPAPYQAARACGLLISNGHADWYLPAKNELNTLYTNKTLIGNFDTLSSYWSSTENSANGAWSQIFSNGQQIASNPYKHDSLSVRCVRK